MSFNTLDKHRMSDVKRPPHPRAKLPCFELWVCGGRICTANGSNAIADACEVAVAHEPRVTVLRGGCYGLCELGPNVVVRRYDDADDAVVVEHSAADRLTLTGAENETVYCAVDVADVVDIVAAHVADDVALVRLTRAVREQELAPGTEIERRIRALRATREKQDPST